MYLAALVRFVHGLFIPPARPAPVTGRTPSTFSGNVLFANGAFQFLRARSTKSDKDGWLDALIVSGAFVVLEWTIGDLPLSPAW